MLHEYSASVTSRRAEALFKTRSFLPFALIRRESEKNSSRKPVHQVYAACCMSIRPVLRAEGPRLCSKPGPSFLLPLFAENPRRTLLGNQYTKSMQHAA